MSKEIRLNKGFDIKLIGEAYKLRGDKPMPSTYAVKPIDFHGVKPKLLVKEGAEVKAGTPLFFNKANERILFTAPVSGEVVEIRRGPKRRIDEVIILADQTISYEDFGAADPSALDREQIIEKLLKSGLWPLLRQRPFAKIANPDDEPHAIMVSCFDSAPLAPDYSFILKGKEEQWNKGINALKNLTKGTLHLNVRGEEDLAPVFKQTKNVQINKFYGPHPSGTIGVQIHHLDPVNKNKVVWYVNPQDVINIGRLFSEGRYNAERTIALTGSEAEERKYYSSMIGANIEPLVKNNVKEGKLRYISGNVLTGKAIEPTGFVGYYDHQLTIIPEGDEPEFIGWLMPSYARPSISRSFPWTWNPDKKFRVNTNIHGEERPFVMTGQYEKVLPMDIYPMMLLKAIMTEDLDRMEGLGIYEVAEEDFALVEFVDTSKLPIQGIIRRGLNIMEKEG